MPKNHGSPSSSSSPPPFLVIGAGLPRTGTLSTRTALAHLLGGKCYHMNVINFARHNGRDEIDFWDKALDGKASRQDWIDFLPGRGFRGGVDFPIAICYKELMEVFPDAKVIFTVRDPKSWYESCKNTIYALRNTTEHAAIQFCGRMLGMLRLSNFVIGCTARMRGFDRGLYDYIEMGEKESIRFFHRWTSKVMSEVPRERMLIFDVREGWDPLCKFLDVPVPTIPFPRVNDTAYARKVLKFFQLAEYLVLLAPPTLISAILYYFIFFNLMSSSL